jgi:hypothetical protein
MAVDTIPCRVASTTEAAESAVAEVVGEEEEEEEEEEVVAESLKNRSGRKNASRRGTCLPWPHSAGTAALDDKR